jgi:CBS domain-containing protein
MPKEKVMKVRDLMIRDVRSCAEKDSLNRAAQLMWEGDYGVVPVLGDDGTVVGMITDRDLCMAAYTRGVSLGSLRVEDAMSRDVTSCSAESSLDTAMSLMREARVRRLPVVDHRGALEGILSMNDLAREARRQCQGIAREDLCVSLADTLGTLCEPRHERMSVREVDPQRVGKLVDAAV